MAISQLTPSVKMYPNVDGHFVPVLIRWNKHTRAWHIRDNRGTLHLHTGTIIPGPTGYDLLNKVWDYDVSHPERINYNKPPLIKNTQHVNLTEALAAYAVTLG